MIHRPVHDAIPSPSPSVLFIPIALLLLPRLDEAFVNSPLSAPLPQLRRSARDTSSEPQRRANAADNNPYDSNDDDGDTDFFDRAYHRIAAEYLVPVLFPNSTTATDKESAAAAAGVPVPVPVPVPADKALKRCLRAYERSWRRRNHTGGDAAYVAASDESAATASSTYYFDRLSSSTRIEREIHRKTLSDLILGTSIVRLKHWYNLYHHHHDRRTTTHSASGDEGDSTTRATRRAIPAVHGVEPWIMMGKDNKTSAGDESDASHSKSSYLATAQQLVALHAKAYMMNGSGSSDDEALAINQKFCSEMSNDVHRIAVQHSLPSFLVRLWIEQYGVNATETMAALSNRPGPITLRRNALRCESDEKLLERLQEELGADARVFVPSINKNGTDESIISVPAGCLRLDFDGDGASSATNKRPKKSLWSLQTWRDGCFEVQDVGSQIIVDSMEIQYDDRVVIDYCAGNGGKTLALASKMWETTETAKASDLAGTVFAHDVVVDRLKQLNGSLARAGLFIDGDDATAKKQHGAVVPRVITVSNASFFETKTMLADAVLVDAPCSSLGVLRRRPSRRWEVTERMVRHEFPKLQLDILKKASLLVKPDGGKLVYATCSVCRDENEGVAERFETLLEDFDTTWERWNFGDSGDHRLALLPHKHESDGFFIARWKRRGVVERR